MNDLSPEARRTLARAKSAQPRASQALRARVKENVLRAVAVAPAGALDSNSAVSAKGSFTTWALPTLGAIVVVGGIATFALQPWSPAPSATMDQRAAVHESGATARPPEQEPPRDPPLTAAEQDGRVSAADESHADESAGRAKGQASQVHLGHARARDNALRAEMQLLSRAEAALRTNEPLSALSILDAHARDFRSGQLQGERAGLRLIAQCTLGRDPEGALQRYLREHRDGVLHVRIRESCARFLR